MVLYDTGIRRTEVSLLKVSDIESQRMIIRVERGEGGASRDLALSPLPRRRSEPEHFIGIQTAIASCIDPRPIELLILEVQTEQSKFHHKVREVLFG